MRLPLCALLLAAGLVGAGPLEDGQALLRTGRPETALAAFERAVAAEPERLEARYWRAVANLALTHWHAAVADFEYVVARKPESAASWLGLSEARLRLGRLGEAGEALAVAGRLMPDSPRVAALREELARRAPKPRPPSEAAADRPVAPSSPGSPPARLGIDGADRPEARRLFEVAGERLYDYTFGAAPTDWEPRGGVWEVSSRYACEPEWSFFGGQSRGICSIWNKRHFEGDLYVEAYVAFKHGLPWAPQAWFYQPSDLNITICARPGDLGSGYSFIYSGDHGRATMIRRGDRVLAETTDQQVVLPQFSDENPLFGLDDQGRQFGRFHRHWWRLEVLRRGPRLTFWVDGHKALETEDSDPLPGGQVALWTINSGMVIARVRIAYAEERRGGGVTWVGAEPTPLPSDAIASR